MDTKRIFILPLLLLGLYTATAQPGNWHLSFGPMVETTKLINNTDPQYFRGDEFTLPFKPSLGFMFASGWQKGAFNVQLSVGLKRNVVRLKHDLEYVSGNGLFEHQAFASESFLAVEPLATIGYRLKLKKGHHLYFGTGAGFAFNNKNSYGSGYQSRSTLADTVDFQFYINGTGEFYHTITPIAAATVEFYQGFRNPKVGMVYGIQNKWGLTPLMRQQRSYDSQLYYGNESHTYYRTWAGHITNLSFYVLFRFDLKKEA